MPTPNNNKLDKTASDAMRANWKTIAAMVFGLLVLVGLLVFLKSRPESALNIPELETALASSLTGTIIAKEGDELKIDIASILGFALGDDSPLRLRTVIVSPTAQIYEQTAKDAREFQREVAVYQRSADVNKFAPAPYNQSLIRAADLQVGDIVSVSELDLADIKYKKVIVAAQIVKSNP